MPLTTITAQNDMPPWIKDYFQRMVQEAEAIRKKPYQTYRGLRAAPIPKDIVKAHEMGRRLGISNPNFKRGEQLLETAHKGFPEGYQAYMNPYMKEVIQRMREESGQNLRENILPALENKFMKLGHYGSSQHKEMTQRALREQQRELLGQEQKALASGYQQAAQMYNADKARMLEAAKEMSTLGGMKQAAHFGEMAALENQGRYQQQQEQMLKDLQYQDFLRQTGYPYQQLSEQNAIMQGIPQTTQSSQVYQTPGTPQTNVMGALGPLAIGLSGMLNATRKKKGGVVRPKHARRK